MGSERKLIEQILKTYRNELPNSASNDPFDVQQAEKYLNEHLFDVACNVSRMRATCKIPQNNFSTRFKCYTGMPPSNYIVYHRIEAAKQLLSNERLKEVSVGELGYAVGYERPSTFTTVFTRKEGIPPGNWRTNSKL